MKLHENISQSLELEEKSTPADKVYNALSMTSGLIALCMMLGTFIAYLISERIGMEIWQKIFFPIAIFLIFSYCCGIPQIIRNRYFSSVFSMMLTTITFLGFLAFILYQIIFYHALYVVPFNYF